MHEKRGLKLLELLVMLVELARLARLLFKRTFALFKFTQYIVDPDEVLLCTGELSLRLILADTVFYNSRCLLDYPSPVLGLGRKDIVDTALSDKRIAVTAKTGIKEKDRNVLKTAVDLVDLILGLSGSVEPSGNADLRETVIDITVRVIESNGYFGIVH